MPALERFRTSKKGFAHPYQQAAQLSQHIPNHQGDEADDEAEDEDETMGEIESRVDHLLEQKDKNKWQNKKRNDKRRDKKHRGKGEKRDQERWDVHKKAKYSKYEKQTVRWARPSHYNLFRSGKRTHENVHAMLAKHFPEPPSEIPVASVAPNKIFIIQMLPSEAVMDDDLPFSFDTMVIRLVSVFTKSEGACILKHWKAFIATNPTLSFMKPRKLVKHLPWVVALQHNTDGSDSRSATPAWHLGCWAKYAKVVRLTAESVQATAAQNEAMDALLTAIKAYILDPICQIMKSLYPRMYARAQNCHEYVCETLKSEFQKRPALNLGPIAFCIAIKDGGSKFPHLDFGDDAHHPSYVAALGERRIGGEWCAPQLNTKVPLESGQVIGAKTAVIVHYTAPYSGPRTAVTMFTCKQLLKLADAWGAERDARRFLQKQQLATF
ncbi:hypothetical protein DL96DRAFT_1625565 [Flagelloscypha sp. PMI_526]|nr:hypothetical protein DL96DRAFT_1625565 [Flagelloscypha sp. PMI_526]